MYAFGVDVPQFGQRQQRDVERAESLTKQRFGLTQKRIARLADDHRFAYGRGVKEADLAVRVRRVGANRQIVEQREHFFGRGLRISPVQANADGNIAVEHDATVLVDRPTAR